MHKMQKNDQNSRKGVNFFRNGRKRPFLTLFGVLRGPKSLFSRLGGVRPKNGRNHGFGAEARLGSVEKPGFGLRVSTDLCTGKKRMVLNELMANQILS